MTPKILLLDPLVRLHRLDENKAREISGLLGFIRELQRRHGLAIVLTHHATKRRSSRPGQALRGSSDLHAFGDSNVYLALRADEIELSVEHRSAASSDPVRLKLVTAPHVHLALSCKNTHDIFTPKAIEERIIELIKANPTQLHTRTTIRQQLKANNQRVGVALANLEKTARVVSSCKGFLLA